MKTISTMRMVETLWPITTRNPSMNRIILIDDDSMCLKLLGFVLESHGFEPIPCESVGEALECARVAPPSAVLLDRHLGGVDGLTLLPEIQRELPNVPVILVTANTSVDQVVVGIRAGVFDYIGKPIDEGRLLASVGKAVEHYSLRRQVSSLLDGRDDMHSFEGMIGTAPGMKVVYEIVRNVAPTDVSVLVSGESGTGKELVASAVHRRSKRARGPYVCLNMASLPRDLLESTLFGHERGAFTGAERRHVGAVEEAEGGTLFLDEITEMPVDLQSKLLRFLQEKSYRRVGGDRDFTADVRVVAATNRDPLAEVNAGRLRLDLYYRLAVVPIALPALRDRVGDIPLLAHHFLGQLARQHGKAFQTIEDEVIDILVRAPWPGNVRQLRHLVERIVVLNNAARVTSAMLPNDPDLVREESATRSRVTPPTPTPTPTPRTELEPAIPMVTPPTPVIEPPTPVESNLQRGITPLAEVEMQTIRSALQICGSIAEAARRLGVSEATIYRRLKVYGGDSR